MIRIRTIVLAAILAASPFSISGALETPARTLPIVNDVLGCDPPLEWPEDATRAFKRVSSSGGHKRFLMPATVYDLTDCMRLRAESA